MYTIVILAEQAMSAGDAQEVVSLHESIEDDRRYFVLIPCDNAALRVENALGTLAAGEMIAAPPVITPATDIAKEQAEIDKTAEGAVEASVSAIRALGHEADGEFTSEDPIEELRRVVEQKSADEIIVMTRPHVVAELFHLDWTSRARRHLGVPILHLLEHEPLDIEAGYGQGITGA